MRKPDLSFNAVGDEDFAANEELVRWLEESGRRKLIRSNNAAPMASLANLSRRAEGITRPLLLGILALACAQYLYVDVMEQILSIRSVIVFVLTS